MTNEEMESQIALQERMNELLRQRTELQNQSTDRTRTQTQVQSDFFNMFNEGADSVKSATNNQTDLASALDEVANSTEQTTEQAGFMDKAMLFLSKSVATVKTGFESLMKVLGPLYRLITLQDVFGFLGKQTGKAARNAGNAFESYQKFKDTLGIMPKTISKFNAFVKESSKTLANAGETVGAFAGIEVGDVTNKFLGYASEMGVGFDLFMDKAKGAYGEIIAFKEGLGMSMDALEDLTYRFGTASFPDFAKQLVGGADDLGLSLKNVSKNFDAAIKDSKNFGYMTRKELTATSLYATKLGMEMSDLASFGNKFDTFEGAAESVGKLSAAFGIQLDTLDMVMEDNPAKKLDMVREALEKSGKSMDTILGDRRQAQYLADSIGLPIAQLEKLASVSTDEFGFTDALDSAAEAQENMSEQEALNMIAENIRDIKNSMSGFDKPHSSFLGALTSGFQDAFEHTAAYKKLIGSMHDSFTSFYKVGTKIADLVGRLFFDPSLVGQKGEDKKVMTAEDAPLFKYFFKPFIEYFDAMKGAAETLMADGGPLEKVFGYLRSIMDPEKFGPANKDFNIFDTLFAPFKDVKKPSLLTPAIQKGLVKVVEILAVALGDAFRFIGNRALAWVDGLLKPVSKTELENETSFLETMTGLGKLIAEGFGDMMSNLSAASGGLRVYFFGGTSGNYTVAKEDSLFYKLFGGAKEDIDRGFEETGLFSEIVSGLAQGLAQMMGNEKLNEVFGKGGVGLGKKFKFMYLQLKKTALEGLADFISEMAMVGQEMQTKAWNGMSGPEQFAFAQLPEKAQALYNPAYFFGGVLASMSGGGIEQTFRDAASNTGKELKSLEKEMNKMAKRNADFVRTAAQAGLPTDAAAAVKKLKEQYTDGYVIDDGTAQELIEVNDRNLERIMNHLADKMYVDNVANEAYNAQSEIAVALRDGFITGTQGSAELTEEATAALMEGNLNKAKEILGVQSPSTEMYEIGTYMADGLIAGFFGDERLIGGSEATGFINRFSEQMASVSQLIEDTYEDISTASVSAIEAKLGRVGEILSGNKPMQVIVDNKQLQVVVNLNVKMDSYDVATAIASAPGGSYFVTNIEGRDDKADGFRSLEFDDPGTSSV
jgi:hypothetical protein